MDKLRINVGCGKYPLKDFTNLDCSPEAYADLFVEVPPLPFHDETADEIYAGHFLEHLDPSDARAFLQECHRVLKPGGKLGIVVPNIREVMLRYISGTNDEFQVPAGVWWKMNDLDHICNVFLYNSSWANQESPHRWAYEPLTLARAMQEMGFSDLTPIDGYRDPRIAAGAWINCGWDGYKHATPTL